MSTAAKQPRFLHPDEDFNQLLQAEKAQPIAGEVGVVPIYNPNMNRSIEQQRQKLPVFQCRNHIIYLLERYRVLVIVGETGSGKSTQIPQYLHEVGWLDPQHAMAVTQPRRIAAVSVAARVAEEKGWTLGEEVGYAIRFENCWSESRTCVKFVTDGMLVRELMLDPLLRRYRVIMLDEAHERTMATDLLLGLLKKVLKRRPNDLRIIISSATLQAEEFKKFFDDLQVTTSEPAGSQPPSSVDAIVEGTSRGELRNCTILRVEGRQFPVDIHFSIDPVPCYLKATVDTVVQLHRLEPMGGDVLVFLTGQEEVQTVVDQLFEINRKALSEAKEAGKSCRRMRPLPLYGNLAFHEQMKVFERPQQSMRKVIVATNIAEASLTLPNIVYVVDCGFTKLRAFQPVTGLEVLLTLPTSKASAKQRAGRAARTSAGKVYRLYTEASYSQLAEHTAGEMQRCDLSHVVLQLKALAIDNFLKFQFFAPPPVENLERSLELLYALGALDEQGHLSSPVGQRMAELPLHPMSSAMIFSAVDFDCVQEAVALAALLQIQNIFVIPPNQRKTAEKARRKFTCLEGDHLTWLNAFTTFERKMQRSGNVVKSWCQSHALNYRGLMRACQLRDQIKRHVVDRFRLPWSSVHQKEAGRFEPILKALVKGFFAQVAYLAPDGSHYRTVRGEHQLHLHPNSVLYPEKWPKWVLFTDTSLGEKHYMDAVSVIEPDLLYTLAPHYYSYGTERERLDKEKALAFRTDSVF